MYIQQISSLNMLQLFIRWQSKITNNDTKEFLIVTSSMPSLQHVINLVSFNAIMHLLNTMYKLKLHREKT